jgi:hypothetical protein
MAERIGRLKIGAPEFVIILDGIVSDQAEGVR